MGVVKSLVGGVLVTVTSIAAVGGAVVGVTALIANEADNSAESRIEQVTAVGLEFDEWFLEHPANDTIFPKGVDYKTIVQSTIDEEPVKGLEDKQVFYFSRGEDNDFALCVADSRDPSEMNSEAYVYFSQSQETMTHDRCTIENLINPEDSKDSAGGIDDTRR